MPNVVRVLSCQLTLAQAGVFDDSCIVVQTGVLIAVQGPFSLELSLGGAKLPEQRQIVREVSHELGIVVESHDFNRRVRS